MYNIVNCLKFFWNMVNKNYITNVISYMYYVSYYVSNWETYKGNILKGWQDLRDKEQWLFFLHYVEVHRSHFRIVLMGGMIRKCLVIIKYGFEIDSYPERQLYLSIYFMVTLEKSLHLSMSHSLLWRLDNNMPYAPKYLGEALTTRGKRKQNCLEHRYFL